MNRIWLGRGGQRLWRGLPPIEAYGFLINGIADFRRVPIEVKVFTGFIWYGICPAECVVIEVVIFFLQLVTETIIRILKVDANGSI